LLAGASLRELVKPISAPGLVVLNQATSENVVGVVTWVVVSIYEPDVPGSESDPAEKGPFVEATAAPWRVPVFVPDEDASVPMGKRLATVVVVDDVVELDPPAPAHEPDWLARTGEASLGVCT
jgi:hypothetical protein